MSNPCNTVERLRDDIDSGRTREKVRGSDPAAAPLGADEEAAGTPITEDAIRLARKHEVVAEPRSEEDGGKLVYALAISGIAILFISAVLLLLR